MQKRLCACIDYRQHKYDFNCNCIYTTILSKKILQVREYNKYEPHPDTWFHLNEIGTLKIPEIIGELRNRYASTKIFSKKTKPELIIHLTEVLLQRGIIVHVHAPVVPSIYTPQPDAVYEGLLSKVRALMIAKLKSELVSGKIFTSHKIMHKNKCMLIL